MQTKYAGMTPTAVIRRMFLDHGVKEFFKGVVPPLVGSAIYRGAMLSGYEFTFTYITLHTGEDHFLKKEYFGCLRLMVPVSVVCASLARGFIEGL